MNYIKNLNVKLKLISVVIIILLSIIMVILSSVIVINKITDNYNEIYKNYIKNEETLDLLKKNMYENRYYFFKCTYNKKIEQINEIKKMDISNYIVYTNNAQYEKESLKKIRKELVIYNSQKNTVIKLLKEGNYGEALNELQNMDEAESFIINEESRLIDINLEYVKQSDNKGNILHTKDNILIMILVSCAIDAAFVFISFVFKDFHKQLGNIWILLNTNAENDVSEDFYNTNRKDEFGEIIRKIIHIRCNFDEVLKDTLDQKSKMGKDELMGTTDNINFKSAKGLCGTIKEAYKGINVMMIDSSIQCIKINNEIKKFHDISEKIKIFKKKSFTSINNIKVTSNRLEDKFRKAIYEGEKLVEDINNDYGYKLDMVQNKDNNYLYKVNNLFQLLYEVEYMFFQLKQVLENERNSFNDIEKIPKEAVDYSKNLQGELKLVMKSIEKLSILANGQQALIGKLNGVFTESDE